MPAKTKVKPDFESFLIPDLSQMCLTTSGRLDPKKGPVDELSDYLDSIADSYNTLVHKAFCLQNENHLTQTVFKRKIREMHCASDSPKEKKTGLNLPDAPVKARVANQIMATVNGMLKSQKELMDLQIQQTDDEIEACQEMIEKKKDEIKAFHKTFNPHKPAKGQIHVLRTLKEDLWHLHQRLDRLHVQKKKYEAQKEKKRYSVCFGTKKRMKERSRLNQKNPEDKAAADEWRQEWTRYRNRTMKFIGSADEPCGNSLFRLQYLDSARFDKELEEYKKMPWESEKKKKPESDEEWKEAFRKKCYPVFRYAGDSRYDGLFEISMAPFTETKKDAVSEKDRYHAVVDIPYLKEQLIRDLSCCAVSITVTKRKGSWYIQPACRWYSSPEDTAASENKKQEEQPVRQQKEEQSSDRSADCRETAFKTEEKSASASGNNSGIIGIDFNVNFFSLCALDEKGDVIEAMDIPFSVSGSSQINAASRNTVLKKVFQFASEQNMKVAIEYLDFKALKSRQNRYTGKRQNRINHLMAYSDYRKECESLSLKSGVPLVLVSPAYTSKIGAIRYANANLLSSHQSAACCIGRRGMGFKEKLTPEEKTKLARWKKKPEKTKNSRKRDCEKEISRQEETWPEEMLDINDPNLVTF